MKARLAKKLTRTPIDRLAPRWTNNFFHSDRHDARFEKALAKWNKREQRNKNNRKRKRTQKQLL